VSSRGLRAGRFAHPVAAVQAQTIVPVRFTYHPMAALRSEAEVQT